MTAASIFHLGPIALTLTGLMCALGFVLLMALSALMRSFFKVTGKKRLASFFVFAIPFALFLARAAYCLCGPERFAGRFFALFALHAGGYSFLVLIAGLILAALAYAHVYDLDRKKFLDLLTPGLIVLLMLIRFSETAPAQSTGHVVTLRFLRGALFTVTDRYGSVRHAVSRLEAFAALAVLLTGGARFLRARRAGEETEHGESFFWAITALSALILPIEVLRDGVYPVVCGVSLDMTVCAALLVAACAASAAQLWQTDVAKQFILVRAVPAAVLALVPLPLSRRAFTMASPELDSFWVLLCALACAALICSLRAARLRRVRAKRAAQTNYVVRIPSEDPAKAASAQEVPVESRISFESDAEDDGEPALFIEEEEAKGDAVPSPDGDIPDQAEPVTANEAEDQ